MGEKSVFISENSEQRKQFMQYLLKDVRALDQMLREDYFETDVQRIGAEQELCLVDAAWRPAPVGEALLEKVNDPHFTTELAKFNVELNLDPLEFTGNCLSKMERQLKSLLNKAKKAAHALDSKILLTGILPTIRNSDLEINNLTPDQRYFALRDVMHRLKGGSFEINIKGTDELITKHNSILLEACNTSFQIHLQVAPGDFVEQYNWAQAITAPVLAAATNSPILFGKRLWHETRIALFLQSTDTRNSAQQSRYKEARVTFGNQWLQGSVLELFKEDIARHAILFVTDVEDDPMLELKDGKVPAMRALRLHNGTVYKWNRACYGVMNGKAHLRIENRVIPSGPTVLDEMANTAFWLGLMKGQPEKYKNIHQKMDFDDVQTNFVSAARVGLAAQFKWLKGKLIPAEKLILKELLPIAREGLQAAKVSKREIDKYLGVIEERVKSHRTGSQWLLDSFSKLKKEGSTDEALITLSAGTYNRQLSGRPVHEWDSPVLDESGNWANRYRRVDQVMETDLFTVHEDDLLDLVTHIMDWRKIRHVPVENEAGELTGLITTETLIHYYSSLKTDDSASLTVGEVMVKSPKTISPESSTFEAVHLMRKQGYGCLPVTKEKKLLGIITENDFVKIAEYLFKELESK